MNAMTDRRHYRSIFISDVHLGTRECKAEALLDFLAHTDSDNLYLVGDMIDGWRLKKNWYWPQSHNDVIQKLLRKAKTTRVVFIPGNHDEFARDYLDNHFGQVEVLRDAVHVTADGRRLLVLHGDHFDGIVEYARWLAFLGDTAYALAANLNRWFNWGRRKLGYPYWSVSTYLKHKVKNAVQYIGNFEKAMVELARGRELDGIVCGHVHHAALRTLDGVVYCNDGDWVESCTALVEHMDGRLELIHWDDHRQAPLPAPVREVVGARVHFPVTPAKAGAEAERGT